MKSTSTAVTRMLLAAALTAGCGEDDGAGSIAGSSSGGATDGHTGTDGTPATGSDRTTGGGSGSTTNSGTDGTTSSGGGGSTNTDSGMPATTASDSGQSGEFWEDSYDPDGLPTPSHGNHHAGDNCMQCHSNGNHAWMFGGTVYQSDGITGAANVQIGISDGGTLRTAYTGTNGNFWFPDDGGAIDWANAEARLRNGDGEAVMPGPPASGCALCHSGASMLIEP